jgi:hypothetical protein
LTTAQDTYEEWRENYEYNEGEARLRPWALLSDQEKRSWEEQWRKYTGELDTTDGRGGVQHGDPAVTDLHKPRA